MFPFGLFINDISEVDIETMDFDVHIHQSNDKEQVELPLGTSIDFDKNKIKITQTQTNEELTKLNPTKKNSHTIGLYLTKKTLEKLYVVTQTGRVTIEDVALPSTIVTIRTIMGTITLNDVSIEKLRVKGQSLKLNVSDIEVQKEGIFVFQKGRIKLKKLLGYNLKIEGKEGTIQMDHQSSFHELHSKVENGYFKAEQIRGDKMNIKIKKRGSINVERSVLEVLRAKTGNGRILVSLPDNFRYGTIELSSDRPIQGMIPDHTRNTKVLSLVTEKGPINFQ